MMTKDHGNIHHLVVGDPAVPVYAFVFDQGDHGVSPAEGEQADLREGQEQSKQHIRLQAVLVFQMPTVSPVLR